MAAFWNRWANVPPKSKRRGNESIFTVFGMTSSYVRFYGKSGKQEEQMVNDVAFTHRLHMEPLTKQSVAKGFFSVHIGSQWWALPTLSQKRFCVHFLVRVQDFSECSVHVLPASAYVSGLLHVIQVTRTNDRFFIYVALRWTGDSFRVNPVLAEWLLGKTPSDSLWPWV